MELPSSRELELEALLRRRDSQLVQLTVCLLLPVSSHLANPTKDELTNLRQYLNTQPGPSSLDTISLPAPLLALLLPHLNASDAQVASSSSTVAVALTQRVRLLQEENDELYELFKSTETGRLKEEVRGLRRAVTRLETALRGTYPAYV